MNPEGKHGTFQPADARMFRRKLLAWYGAHRRELPWRATCDPYRVWISEIMLQQTRVAAVIEHYHAFLRRFPTVEKLAKARESSVLAVWSGLGYYRRARMLHAAAKIIVRQRGGMFPDRAEQWLTLPGIGRYTAAAIASIIFGEPVAVVDGNVERVLHRVSGKTSTREQCWNSAQQLLDIERPGDFNQAMMELGATVCTPRAPACLTCPIVDMCATRGEMAKRKPAPQEKCEIHCSLVVRGNHHHKEVFLVRRPRDASLMAGMWELPGLDPPNGTARPIFTVRHSITVRDYMVRVWQNSITQCPGGGAWFATSRLKTVALTGLARKILRKSEIL